MCVCKGVCSIARIAQVVGEIRSRDKITIYCVLIGRNNINFESVTINMKKHNTNICFIYFYKRISITSIIMIAFLCKCLKGM